MSMTHKPSRTGRVPLLVAVAVLSGAALAADGEPAGNNATQPSADRLRERQAATAQALKNGNAGVGAALEKAGRAISEASQDAASRSADAIRRNAHHVYTRMRRADDPTRVSDSFRQTFRSLSQGYRRPAGGDEPAFRMPEIELLGLAYARGRKPAAMLTIQHDKRLVKKGDEVSFAGQGGELLVLRVEDVKPSEVRLSILPYHETMVLR